MKKAHIALVGGQPVPVYIGVKDDGQANDIILVCSADSRVEAERLKTNFPKRAIAIEECSPVAIPEIEALATRLAKLFSDYEVTLNLTSGTKLWALTFFRVFNDKAYATFIYVDQNNIITDIIRNESHSGKIDILTRISLYGTPLTDFRIFEDYTEADFQMLEKIQYIRNANKLDFLLLTNDNDSKMLVRDEDLNKETIGGSFLRMSTDGLKAKIKVAGRYKTRETVLECERFGIFAVGDGQSGGFGGR